MNSLSHFLHRKGFDDGGSIIKFETKFQGTSLKGIVFQKLSLKFETKFQGNKVTILQK